MLHVSKQVFQWDEADGSLASGEVDFEHEVLDRASHSPVRAAETGQREEYGESEGLE